MDDVVAKTAACTAGTASGRHSADSVCAGRPFFIRIGVSQASEAPAANSASRTPGHSRGSRSSTLVSRTTGPPGARLGRLAQHQPDDVRQLGRVAAAGAGADPLDPHRRQRRPLVHQVRRRSAAPVGRAHLGRHRRRRRPGRRRAVPARPGRGSGRRRARPRAEPLPSATGEAVSRVEAEVREPGDHARRRRPARPAPRPRGSAPRRGRSGARGPRRRPAARTPPARRPGRRGRAASASSARTSGQVRWSRGVGACTCTRVAPSPCRVTCSVASRIGSTGSAATASARHLERHPGVDERAEQHVAGRTRREVQPPDRHASIIQSPAS